MACQRHCRFLCKRLPQFSINRVAGTYMFLMLICRGRGATFTPPPCDVGADVWSAGPTISSNGAVMINRSLARLVLGLLAGSIALGTIACAGSPSRPTAAPASSSAAPWTVVTGGTATPATLARGLGGSADASCFSAGRAHGASATSGALLGAPVFNNNQPVLNSGPTVTLSWTPAAGGTPASYVVEASSTPGGPANLANFNTGNPQTTL